jgi:arabinofuranan 3-O-arabinosyltransferase
LTGTLAGQATQPADPAIEEPSGEASGEASAQAARRIAGRVLTPGICLLLALLPFITAPGQIIADTKLNLAVSPAGFLARALTLWDPQQFGGLQNQAVGYLFPMGPFFALGKLAAVPAWITQRLWIAVLLIAAFTGAQRLAARFGIGVPWTRAVAGLAYALSPIALSMTGQMSGEFLPMAMLPWILLPLAGAARGQVSPWRAAARSAVAVALCSGMNAASTVAVLVPALIYVLFAARTRSSPSSSRWRLLAWWAPAALLATCSWSVPLVLLARYGVSFLPYTESAAVTTAVTSLSDVLRGTSDWVSYLDVTGQPWWPLGFRIATGWLPVLLTGLIAAAGLAGLIVRVPVTGPAGPDELAAPAARIAERRFLLLSVIAGVAIIGTAHVSSLGNPLAGPLDSLINGPASPFRNLWKFDPMIRLPVAFGLAHLLAARRPERVLSRVLNRALFTVTGLAIAIVAGLAYISGLAGPGSFGSIPSYWGQAAGWLNAHAGHQGVLVEPGAPFGQYLWGSPLDDVLSPLTSADFARRDLSDIGSVGNQRLLDAIDQQMAAGDGSAGLTDLLARMGVKYVVVRNDLDRSALNGAWPARIHQALSKSPGITRVAQFGTFVGSFAPDNAVSHFDAPYPPVEIYQVAGAEPVATVQPAAGTLRVYGGPESLLTLGNENLLGRSGSSPVLLNDDGAGQPTARSVVSDSLRRRARSFGTIRGSYSPTLTATQPSATFEAADDFTEPGWTRYQSVARYTGIADVTASSSASDVAAIPGEWSSGRLPYAAVDANLFTRWESGSWTGPVGQWIQLKFDAAIDPRTIDVAFDASFASGPPVMQVRITTAAGEATDAVQITSDMQPLRVPSGPTGWLRIIVTGLALRPVPPTGAQVGIYAIAVPGVQAARTIVTPAVPGPDPSAVVLAKDEPQPSGCMLTSMRWVCSPSLAASTEEQFGLDRTFYENSAEPAAVHGSAILLNASLADQFTRLGPHEPQVTASSVDSTADPQDQPMAAFDGNPATSWVAAAADRHPTLRIQWDGARTLSQLTVERPPGASGFLEVRLTGSGGQRRVAWASRSGVLTFAPMRTSSLALTFLPSYSPVQVTGVDIPGVPQLGTPTGTFRLPCGLGPSLTVNGRPVPTRVTGSFASLLAERPVQFTACSPVRLAAGANRLVEPVTDVFSIQDAVVQGTGTAASPPEPPPAAAGVVRWTATARTLRVSAAVRSYLVVDENFNAGWKAVIGGRTLTPVRLDGWKQAWVLPAGTSGLVRLTFGPERLFRVTVFGGLAVLALVVLAAAWLAGPRRRRGPPPAQVPAGKPDALAARVLREPLAFRTRRGLRLTGQLLQSMVALAALAGIGLWLGGYPGAVILPLTTSVFLMAASGLLPADGRLGRLVRVERELPRPWLLAGLVLLASISAVAGQYLQSREAPALIVTALQNGIPQFLLIIVIGRLAAALILS